jgi:transcriptional regulator with XRE-family HTH domain
MSIGENIKKYRIVKHMTQKELAEKANISRSYLADVENNRYNPSVEVLKSIAKALNISVDKFFKENNGNDDLIKSEKNAINPKLKPIIDSLDRAGDLQDEDINEIARQVQFLIEYQRTKKRNS